MVKNTTEPLKISNDSVPRDISSSMSKRIDEEIPSRSYYSSHLIIGSTDEQVKYSESTDYIRAHSLALSDKYLQETNSVSSLHKLNSYNSNCQNTPNNNSDLITIPVSPVVPNTQSALSSLLKNSKNLEEEPLLKSNIIYQDYSSRDNKSNFDPELGYNNFSVTSDHDFNKNETYHNRTTKEPNISLKKLKSPDIWIDFAKQGVNCIPAIVLGLLLNLLDAISYGMITFPLNNPIFASFGPDGISMFLVSSIVSQLVYSCGGSIFSGGNGSMMIEVVPFLHIMAETIESVVGSDKPDIIISSTVVAFAISSIMTGLAFFLLGALKLGSLIGFFPRHILIGTIGGVGWFLIATGIEVSGRLDENLNYTIPMFKKIFMDYHTLSLWTSAFAVAILLRLLQSRIRSPLLVPTFFMAVPVVFYVVIFILGMNVTQVRNNGWIFPLVQSNLPFWHFYTYYNFKLVDWRAVAETVPAMLALTFFGVLHVPINVPALGVSLNKDDVDVNRELVAHGISNAASGLLGSLQNYLVYTNSLLFIRSGGDSRLAGILLACATTVLWIVGPWIVGYIPIMVVGSLIFHLGLDLLKEALIDTWHHVNFLEYVTIIVIVVCMATFGFVEGIFIGIVMACIFFVLQNARRSKAIRSVYTGQNMRSTVRRLFRQEEYLKRVGNQIQIVKLQGYLFFGTIDQVESAIRSMLEEYIWSKHPIRFLILDFHLVQGLDFSAAEAFVRIRRLLRSRQIYMIMCNVIHNSEEEKALIKAGIWDLYSSLQDESDIKCFEHLNDAIEWCENELLTAYFERNPKPLQILSTTVPYTTHSGHKLYSYSDILASENSPRHNIISKAITHVISETRNPVIHKNTTQPTLILVQTLGELENGTIPIEFFHKLSQYFTRETSEKGEMLYKEGDSCDFFLVLEQGSLRRLMCLSDEEVTVETILPGAIVGELGIIRSSSVRRHSVITDSYSIYWKLTRESFNRMCHEEPEIANQFIRLALYFPAERLDTMTRYAFHLH